MQLTLTLNRRTHLFIRDGKLFFKLYKLNKFSDKKDYPILSDVSLEQAEQLHKWLGDVIAECKQPLTASNAKSIDASISTSAQMANISIIVSKQLPCSLHPHPNAVGAAQVKKTR